MASGSKTFIGPRAGIVNHIVTGIAHCISAAPYITTAIAAGTVNG
jgi:hypothetical protein